MAASGALEDIPLVPGVYAYYVSFMSRRSLGLFQGECVASDDIQNAKRILEKKFKRYLALRKQRQYRGKIRDGARHGHLSPSYEVELEENFSELPLRALLAMKDKEFINALDMMESTLLLQPPVYVGIAVDQTLRDRCLQHKSDFELGSEGSSFGSRLRKMGLEWSDLIYVARASKSYGAELKEVEKAIQLLVNPILSLR